MPGDAVVGEPEFLQAGYVPVRGHKGDGEVYEVTRCRPGSTAVTYSSITSRWRRTQTYALGSSHGIHSPHHHDPHQAGAAHRLAAEAELVRGRRGNAGTGQGRWVPFGR